MGLLLRIVSSFNMPGSRVGLGHLKRCLMDEQTWPHGEPGPVEDVSTGATTGTMLCDNPWSRRPPYTRGGVRYRRFRVRVVEEVEETK